MKIKPPPRLTNRDTYLKYLEVDLWNWLREISSGMTRLDFEENFPAVIVAGIEIAAMTEIAIANPFRGRFAGAIPRGRIIVRQTGDANIIDGDTAWTIDAIYLKNPSANDAIVSVLFFL